MRLDRWTQPEQAPRVMCGRVRFVCRLLPIVRIDASRCFTLEIGSLRK
jgi:hypothetical protein